MSVSDLEACWCDEYLVPREGFEAERLGAMERHTWSACGKAPVVAWSDVAAVVAPHIEAVGWQCPCCSAVDAALRGQS